MYEDSVVTGYKMHADSESAGSEGAGYIPEENASKIAWEQQRRRESSIASPPSK